MDWEPLPAVADPFAAMADGAPQLFDDAPKNIEHSNIIKAGDPDAAFAKAHKVVKQRMNSQRLSGIPMETRAVMADAVPNASVAWPEGNERVAGILTRSRWVVNDRVRSGRCLRMSGLKARLTTAAVTPTESMPRAPARAPCRPPTSASARAIPVESRE